MDRYNFKEHISAYIDGELSPEDKIKFEELMESDSNCREQYNQINSLVKNLSSIGISPDSWLFCNDIFFK